MPFLVDPFDETAIDCAAYTLHVGDQVYISPDGTVRNPERQTKQLLKAGEGFAIPPGQFAFLLTKEIVSVPEYAVAFISIKGRMKFKGLVNISGFHVDPGYTGRLLFSVLNAGPRPIHLEQGQRLFLIWYADLDSSTDRKKTDRGFENIDVEFINGISGEILSLQSLSDRQRSLENKQSQQNIQFRIVFSVGLVLLTATLGTFMTLIMPRIWDWVLEIIKTPLP